MLLKVAIGLCHEASWRADIGEAAHVEALLATVEGLLWVRGPGGAAHRGSSLHQVPRLRR